MAKYFNAIVRLGNGGYLKYRKISFPKKFIDFIIKENIISVIFFYDNETKQYLGYWSPGRPPGVYARKP